MNESEYTTPNGRSTVVTLGLLPPRLRPLVQKAGYFGPLRPDAEKQGAVVGACPHCRRELRLWESEDGLPVTHCAAGCPPDDVLAAFAAIPDDEEYEDDDPETAAEAAAISHAGAPSRPAQPRLESRPFSEIEREQYDWFWSGYLAYGTFALLEGPPGVGKSTVLAAIAAAQSAGAPLPGGTAPTPAAVLMFGSEDMPGATTGPRLEAAGADLNLCRYMDGLRDDDGEPRPFASPDDLPYLREAIRQFGAKVVVFDMLPDFLPPGIKENENRPVRRAVGALGQVAREEGVLILGARHHGKSEGGSALTKGIGSTAYAGVARTVLTVVADPDDPEQVLLAVAKSNLGPKPSTLTLRLTPVGDVARVEWVGTDDRTADEIVRPPDAPPHGATAEAAAWLGAFLSDGPRRHADIASAALAAQHSPSALKAAKKELGVKHRRFGGAAEKGWVEWSLTGWQATPTPTGTPVSPVSPVSAGDAEGGAA